MKKFLLLIWLLPVLITCKNDDDSGICPNSILIDEEVYRGVQGEFEVLGAEINGDCLNVTVSYGRAGSSQVLLVTEDSWLDALPIIRYFRLTTFEDTDGPAVTQSFSFDLTKIQVERYDEMRIRIDGWSELLPYSY